MKKDYAELLEEWKQDCPLVRWRKAKGLSRAKIAAALHVALNSINNWETGATVPSDKSLARIADAMKDPNVKEAWMTWLEQQPKL